MSVMINMDKAKRNLIKFIPLAGLSLGLKTDALWAASKENLPLATIPSSQEKIFPIGMGTWITFNVGNDHFLREQRSKVLKTFFELGGQMIDSSPMYASSEQVLGHCLENINNDQKLFSATKTWTSSSTTAKHQFSDSLKLWQQKQIDLLQVHNLVSWQNHLAYLQELKQEKLIRYIGVTTSHGRRHAELEKILKSQKIDFVQLTYNIVDRSAENRLLPLAQEQGVGVIANRPFQRGNLISHVKQHPLPPWASSMGIYNWPQYFLRFIVSHSAITCAIPATSQVPHMIENMGAINNVALPSTTNRNQMIEYFQSL